MIADFQSEGLAICRGLIPTKECRHLREASFSENRIWSMDVFKDRLDPVTQMAKEILSGARPVRVTIFDKSADRQWALPWHQDRVIALQNKPDHPDFTHHTQKNGIFHCEAPVTVLSGMLFAVVLLDPVNPENGPTEFAIGTDQHGKIAAREIAAIVRQTEKRQFLGQIGDVAFAKFLTLHRSLSATNSGRRRQIRIDYAPEGLNLPEAWAFRN